jgi:hypothetical protein
LKRNQVLAGSHWRQVLYAIADIPPNATLESQAKLLVGEASRFAS